MLFPHAERALVSRPVEMKYLGYWCKVLGEVAWYLSTQGNYLPAEKMSRQALDGFGKVLGEEHPDTLTSVSNLASVLYYQGMY